MNYIQHIIRNMNNTDFIGACLLNGTSIDESYKLASALVTSDYKTIENKISEILSKYEDKDAAALKIFRVFPKHISGEIEASISENENLYDLIKLTISKKVSSIYFQKNALRAISPDKIPSFYDKNQRYGVYVKYALKDDELYFCFVKQDKVSARDGVHYKIGATPQGDGTLAGAVSKALKENRETSFYKIGTKAIQNKDDVWYNLEFVKSE